MWCALSNSPRLGCRLDEIVGALGAVAAAKRRVGKRIQIVPDRLDAGLGCIGAGDIGAAAVSVLGVPVVGRRHRIGVLDLICRRRRRIAVGIGIEQRRTVSNHDVIGASAAGNRLMIIVGERVVVGELIEIGYVTGKIV